MRGVCRARAADIDRRRQVAEERERRESLIAIGALALAACAGSASAAVVNGTMGFVPIGSPGTFVGSTLAQATSFNWGGPLHLINNPGPATFGGLPNIFNGAIAASVTVSSPITLPGGAVAFAPPVTLNNNYPSLFTVAFGGSNIRFSSTSQSFTSSGPNSLNIRFEGTAVDLNNVFSGVANAAMTMNFTILSGKQVNYSTSFATSGLVPTPGAAAILGLGGLIAARRRR
jgi:hypothetical protein